VRRDFAAKKASQELSQTTTEVTMNHGGELLFTLLPWLTTLLVAVAVYDDLDFSPPHPKTSLIT
jgi:hypothetical protein